MLYRVQDTTFSRVSEEEFDLAIFASGFEPRSVHVASKLTATVGATIVLGFKELPEDESRVANDLYFTERSQAPVTNAAGDDGPIYSLLTRALGGVDRRGIRILVDYSSMSRVWYAAILNWARYARHLDSVTVTLLYSVGEHREPVTPLRITEIVSIPGCEGSSTPLVQSVAIFGLGFDGVGPLCVLDQLEPDVVYAYLASPSMFKDYPIITRKHNRELIDHHARSTFGLPLDSVEQTFRQLTEIISPHRISSDITIVPMGPKPHVLAAILLAMRFEEVGCLRVVGQRSHQERVTAQGPVLATEVEFRPRWSADATAKSGELDLEKVSHAGT